MIDADFMPDWYARGIEFLADWNTSAWIYGACVMCIIFMHFVLLKYEIRQEKPRIYKAFIFQGIQVGLLTSRDLGIFIALFCYIFVPGWHETGITGAFLIVTICLLVGFNIRIREILRTRRAARERE